MNEVLAQQHRDHLARQTRLNGQVQPTLPVRGAVFGDVSVDATPKAPKQKSPQDLAFKAIEEEFQDICRGAQAIYDVRMKDARAKVRDARIALKIAEDGLSDAQSRFHEEYRANVEEANQWRREARKAVRSRPIKLSRLGKAASEKEPSQ